MVSTAFIVSTNNGGLKYLIMNPNSEYHFKPTGNMNFRISLFGKKIILTVEVTGKSVSMNKQTTAWRDARASDFVECPELSEKLMSMFNIIHKQDGMAS